MLSYFPFSDFHQNRSLVKVATAESFSFVFKMTAAFCVVYFPRPFSFSVAKNCVQSLYVLAEMDANSKFILHLIHTIFIILHNMKKFKYLSYPIFSKNYTRKEIVTVPQSPTAVLRLCRIQNSISDHYYQSLQESEWFMFVSDHKGPAITNVFTFTTVCVCVFSSRRSVGLGKTHTSPLLSTLVQLITAAQARRVITHKPAFYPLSLLVHQSHAHTIHLITPAGRPRRLTEVVLVIFSYTSNGF